LDAKVANEREVELRGADSSTDVELRYSQLTDEKRVASHFKSSEKALETSVRI
jgi:hypothetical protein